MNKKVLLNCLVFLCLGLIIGATITYLKTPKEGIEVSIRKTADENVIAFFLIRATSSDFGMNEIITRADNEAEKLGGSAQLTNVSSKVVRRTSGFSVFNKVYGREVDGREEFFSARFIVIKTEDI